MAYGSGLALCVPNFSEGRRQEVIEAVVEAFAQEEGVKLLDHKPDASHNRTVVTLVGSLESLIKAALAGTLKAVELIDMREHQGGHPRMGAMDVIPFIPLMGSTVEDCVEASKALAETLSSEMDLPVHLYEESARNQQRRNLAYLRRGEWEGLTESLGKAGREPDYGPHEPHPTAGAVVVGARKHLIAYNVNLATDDLELAQRIARGVRARNGGYAYVKGMGLRTEDERGVQVSMNLTDFAQTPIHRVVETIRSEAARYGVTVYESEIVGLVPAHALIDAACHYLQLNGFKSSQVLEYRLIEEAF